MLGVVYVWYRHNFDEVNYIDLNVYLGELIYVYSLK